MSDQGGNPTGNPFPQNFKIPQVEELKNLQVKAKLNLLPEAPRAYVEKLQEDGMAVDNLGGGGRLTVCERFTKI